MKDHRLQGQTPEELAELKNTFSKGFFFLEGRLWCTHCDFGWFFVYEDLLVCMECKARHAVQMPSRLRSKETARIICECGDYRAKIGTHKLSCRKCGKEQRWRDPLIVTRLYQSPVELQEKTEILTGYKLKKVLEEGLDA